MLKISEIVKKAQEKERQVLEPPPPVGVEEIAKKKEELARVKEEAEKQRRLEEKKRAEEEAKKHALEAARLRLEEETQLREETTLRAQQQKLEEYARSLEEMKQKMEEEVKSRAEEEIRKRLEEERKKTEEEAKKLVELEAQIQTEREARLKAEAERLRVQEERLAEYVKRAEETRRRLEEGELRAEVKEKPKEEVPAPVLPPLIERKVEVPVRKAEEPQPPLVEEEMVEKAPSWAEDEEMIKRSVAIYEEALSLARASFELAQKERPLDVQKITEVISRIVEQVAAEDSELLRQTVRSSPENYLFCQAVNTCILALEIGIGLAYSKPKLNELGQAAFLHDLGHITARETIEFPGKLKEVQREEVKKHPLYSVASLKTAGLSERVISAIIEHHERVDGRGYPKGLRSGEIGEYAKIIQVVDAFEAISHDRPYHKAKPVNEAMKELIEIGEKTYEPNIVKALVGRLGLYPVRSLVELSTGQIARVVKVNRQFPLRPIVSVEFDSRGNPLERPKIIDLLKQSAIHITTAIADLEKYSRTKVELKEAHQEKEKIDVKRIVVTIVLAVVIILVLFILLKI